MNTAIELRNLSKTFGRGRRRVNAVQNVSLQVQAGQVYGFLGPNGAGKTTAIRMMLSLLKPTAGEVRIYGKSVQREHDVLRNVGALVEGPAFYPYLSGRRNLQVLADTSGGVPQSRIEALLDQVGLTTSANRYYRTYSLGMKQRLGMAAALLHDPALLIFDEPTNGLDPAGMQEIRLFIRELADVHEKTVFLSSHLLNEVEQVCDRIAIISKGTIVREGMVRDLLGAASSVRFRVTPLQTALEVLQARYPVLPNGSDHSLTLQVEDTQVPQIVQALVAAQVEIYEIVRQQQSLEEYFLNATREAEAS